MDEFCDAVEALVKQQYGVDDGGDLCWSLLEQQVIKLTDTHERAARIVAQHLLQA